MSGQQLISVVIAVYARDNANDFRTALASILNQSYTPIEVLVVVDGTIDSAKSAILDEFEKHGDWHIVRLPKNAGPAAARNVGILAARGAYVAIMDADDISHRDRLKIQKEHLERENLDVVSSPVFVIDEHGDVTGSRSLPSSMADVRKLAPYSCPLNNPAVFGKARVLKANLYNEQYRVSEDYDLWIRLLLGDYSLGNTVEKTIYYRQSKAAIAKRRGTRYAWLEMRVRLRAASLVAWHERPMVWLVAFFGAAARLLPKRLFDLLYQTKASRYDRMFRVGPQEMRETGSSEVLKK